jgi:hypothetical protein
MLVTKPLSKSAQALLSLLVHLRLPAEATGTQSTAIISDSPCQLRLTKSLSVL